MCFRFIFRQHFVNIIVIVNNNNTGRDYPNDSIIENGQNTKESPGDLRRLAVTQTPVKNPIISPSCEFLNFFFTEV